MKFNKLLHTKDSKLTNNTNCIANEYISGIIVDHDQITEGEFSYPSSIKKKIKQNEGNFLRLSKTKLNLDSAKRRKTQETPSLAVDVVEIYEDNKSYIKI